MMAKNRGQSQSECVLKFHESDLGLCPWNLTDHRGVKMARSYTLTWHDTTDFDGCGLDKYCYISLGPTSSVNLRPSHNPLVLVRSPRGNKRFELTSLLDHSTLRCSNTRASACAYARSTFHRGWGPIQNLALRWRADGNEHTVT
jgi:hypothetical protein